MLTPKEMILIGVLVTRFKSGNHHVTVSEQRLIRRYTVWMDTQRTAQAVVSNVAFSTNYSW